MKSKINGIDFEGETPLGEVFQKLKLKEGLEQYDLISVKRGNVVGETAEDFLDEILGEGE